MKLIYVSADDSARHPQILKNTFRKRGGSKGPINKKPQLIHVGYHPKPMAIIPNKVRSKIWRRGSCLVYSHEWEWGFFLIQPSDLRLGVPCFGHQKNIPTQTFVRRNSVLVFKGRFLTKKCDVFQSKTLLQPKTNPKLKSIVSPLFQLTTWIPNSRWLFGKSVTPALNNGPI